MRAGLEGGEIAQLPFGDSGFSAHGRMDIDSEGAADQCRNLDLYQFFQFQRNQSRRSDKQVHTAGELKQFRVMGAQAGAQRDAAQAPANKPEDEPGLQAQIAIGDSNASCHMNPAYDGEIETSA